MVNDMATIRETEALLEAAIMFRELISDKDEFEQAIRRLQTIMEHGVTKRGNADSTDEAPKN